MVVDSNQQDLEGYLELFIDYQLKLIEAKQLGLDKKKEYIKDTKSYRKELTLQYLEDSEITEEIIEEMYQRSLKEVHASHILINIPAYAFGKDTVKAYNKIAELRQRVLAGEDMYALAEEFSEEPSAKTSKGDLGYFGSLQMVMAFEDAAFSTLVDSVSEIIRTGFGYHFLKVHAERPALPKLRAAHLLVIKTKDSIADKTRVYEAYEALQNGKPFAKVVKQYSQDAATVDQGGELEPFDRIDIRIPEFIDVAYSLEEGELSQPFQSATGWHIIKLLERMPSPTREEKEKEIREFFNSRGNTTYYDQKKYDKLVSIMDYEVISDTYIEDILSFVNREYIIRRVAPISVTDEENKEIIRLGDRKFYYNDFLDFLGNRAQYATEGMSNQQLILTALNSFKRDRILDAYSEKLYIENKEFAASIDEYNNGILMFDLMQQEVWEQASKDTLGQKQYYVENASNFDMPKRWKLIHYSVKDQNIANQIQEKLNSGVLIKDVDREFRITSTIETWTKDSKKIKEMDLTSDQAKIFSDKENYMIWKVLEVLPSEKRDYRAARNDVVQAYQTAYEKTWVENLHKKYEVKLKKSRWKRLKSKIK